MYTHVLLIF